MRQHTYLLQNIVVLLSMYDMDTTYLACPAAHTRAHTHASPKHSRFFPIMHGRAQIMQLCTLEKWNYACCSFQVDENVSRPAVCPQPDPQLSIAVLYVADAVLEPAGGKMNPA